MVVPFTGTVPAVPLHAVQHEDDGVDEVDVTGLAGLLADDQHVIDAEVLAIAAAIIHAIQHQNGGADEIDVTGLSGLLADDQHVLDAEVLAIAAALVHAARHENGGADEIDVGGLSGLLADDQHVLDAEVLLVAAALVHAARHENGGADEVNVGGLSGLLADDQHVIDAEVLAVAAALIHKDRHDPEDGADPLDTAVAGTIQPDDAAAVGTSHSLSRADHQHAIVAAVVGAINENASAEGVATSFARSDHNHQHTAALHENGGGAEISVAGLSGLLADDQHVLDAEVLLVAAPLVHAARHENGGADEVSIAGLAGESTELAAHKVLTTGVHGAGASTLATVANIATHAAIKAANAVLGHVIVEDASLIDVDGNGKLTLGAHASTHNNGGTDEVSVVGLSGLLADDQHVLDAEVLLVAAALVHAARHNNGGADEVSVVGLSGLLADDQHVLDAEVVAVALALAGGTMAGNINMAGNDIVFTNGRMQGGPWASYISIRNDADTGLGSLYVGNIDLVTFLTFNAATAYITAQNVNGSAVQFKARTTGVGTVEVARLMGAVDPYFGMGNAGGGLRVYRSNKVELQTPLFFPDATSQASAVRFAHGTYTGNDADNRQIAVGFVCKLVVVSRSDSTYLWICNRTDESTRISEAPAVENDALDLLLHAADGFVVDALFANQGTVVYTYFAIGV